MKIEIINNLKQIYDYQMHFIFPYKYPTEFSVWKKSFLNDIDGQGRTSFKELHGKVALCQDKVVGFIQYGKTAFGFDEHGEISGDMSYPVIIVFRLYGKESFNHKKQGIK